MKYVLAILTITTALSALATGDTGADRRCREAGEDLRVLENHLFFQRYRGDSCTDTTPEQVGVAEQLSGDDLAYFNETKCKSLTALEDELAQMESRMLVSDGLSELRNLTVDQGQSVADAASRLNGLQNLTTLRNRVQAFTESVGTGALVQDFLTDAAPFLPELLRQDGPSRIVRLENLCQASAHRQRKVCQSLVEFRTRARDASVTEFGNFLAELSATNTTAQSLQEYRSLLTLQNGTQQTDYYGVWSSMESADVFAGYLAVNPDDPRRALSPTSAQVAAFRSLRLSAPRATASPVLTQMLARIRAGKEDLQSRGQLEVVRQTLTDNADRHLARAKARWSQLWQKQNAGQPLGCGAEAQRTGPDFKTCLEGMRAQFGPGTMEGKLLNTIISGVQLSIDSKQMVTDCLVPEALRYADLLSTPPSSQCNKAGLADVTANQTRRRILQGFRNKIADQEQTWAQFRQHAVNQLANCGDIREEEFYEQPGCSGTSLDITAAPLVQFSLGTMQVLDRQLPVRGNFGLPTDCDTLPDPLKGICRRMKTRQVDATEEAAASYTPGRTLRSTRTDGRNRQMEAVIVADAVAGTAANVVGTYFRERANTDALRTQLANYSIPQPYQPYSGLPPGMCSSLSASVLCYGTFNLGYGTYYNNVNCPNCNFALNPQVFRDYYGLSGVSSLLTPPMATTTTMPSSFFGGGGALAGSILPVGQFGQ